jgi:hypothetical protein
VPTPSGLRSDRKILENEPHSVRKSVRRDLDETKALFFFLLFRRLCLSVRVCGARGDDVDEHKHTLRRFTNERGARQIMTSEVWFGYL